MSRPTAAPTLTTYNPQTWNRSGPVSGAYVPHSTSTLRERTTRDISGLESQYIILLHVDGAEF